MYLIPLSNVMEETLQFENAELFRFVTPYRTSGCFSVKASLKAFAGRLMFDDSGSKTILVTLAQFWKDPIPLEVSPMVLNLRPNVMDLIPAP